MGLSSGLGIAGAVPIGVVNPFAGATAPSGWLLCFGQTVSRSQYSGLFSVISTTYGSGDGSTPFALPDMRGRTIAGKDDMGGTAASRITAGSTGVTGTTLGAAGGDQNIPLHAHANTVTNNAVTSGNDSPDHTHGTYGGAFSGSYPYTSVWDSAGAVRTSDGASNRHTHSVTSNVTITNVNAGTGVSANLQPTIILNYIIKAQ